MSPRLETERERMSVQAGGGLRRHCQARLGLAAGILGQLAADSYIAFVLAAPRIRADGCNPLLDRQ
jgi:hypothetical protein